MTSIIADYCGLSQAPCKPADRATLAQMFVRVEGMEQAALAADIDRTWTDFPFLRVRDEAAAASRRISIGPGRTSPAASTRSTIHGRR